MLFANAARAVLIVVLVAAPWWFGGVTAVAQFWLGLGVQLAMLLWLPSLLTDKKARPMPSVLVPIGLMLLFGAVQLIPLPGGPGVLQHAELSSWLTGGLVAKPAGGPISIDPSGTRQELCRLLIAASILLMASDLFRTRTSRLWFYTPVVINGTVLAVFGIVQKLSWNGLMFGRVPITIGQPFSSFVNRNNAAGYLNLCLACGVALLVLTFRRSRSDGHSRPLDQHWVPYSRFDRFLPLVIVGLLGTMTLGVFVSTSRGGIVSLVAMALGVAALSGLTHYRRLVLGGLVLIGVTTVVMLAWLGVGRAVGARLSTLRDIERISDARPLHWSDSLRAVRDFPLAGLGLGTYHYANRPYQSHVSSGWYYNADNEYVEWLVEGGIIAAALVVWLLFLLTGAAVRLIRSVHGVIDAGVALMLVLVGQSIQALTDFGISLPANQWLAAAICGLAVGTTFRIQESRQHPRMKLKLAPSWSVVLLATLTAATTGLALKELWTLSRFESLAQSTPQLNSLEQPDPYAVEVSLGRALELLPSRPDDASLHLLIAQLYLHRLRQALLDSTQQEFAGEVSDAKVWEMTRPFALHYLSVTRAVAGNDRTTPLADQLPAGEAPSDLEQCVDHLRQAQAACRLLPDVDNLLGCLDVDPQHRREQAEWHFRREVCLSPTDLGLLHRTAAAAITLGMTELAILSLRQELQLDPDRTDEVLKLALPALGESTVLDDIIPHDSPQALVRFADQASVRRSDALEMAHAPIAASDDPQDLFLKARIAELTDRTDEAIKLYQQSVALRPLDVDGILKLAEVLQQEGRLDEALEQTQVSVATGTAATR